MKKLLKKVLLELGDEPAIDIASVLEKAKSEGTTAEKIAEHVGMEVKDVRKVLYVLQDNELVQSHKIHNKKSKRSYFLWQESLDNVYDYLIRKKVQKIDTLKKQLNFQSKVHFRCENCENEEFSYMDAINNHFLCPICNKGKLESVPNQGEHIESLKLKISKLQEETNELQKEKPE